MNKTIIALLFTMITTHVFSENTLVKMETSSGDIYLKLYDDKAPLSVENFVNYANEGFYNGTIFHRVISTFMIQGGGFDEDFQRKPTKGPIKNEANNGLKNLRGTIAMARLPDPQSATSQFFINVQDNAALNFMGEQNSRTWGYAVFGEVVEGMVVVDDIRFTPTAGKNNTQLRKDVPVKNIVIESVTVIDALPASSKPAS